ncbi:5-formyltetrahydrofolate cyclo-ligase [Saccharothrix violaceirubra]|uniref:5-formyltetrahydrofolate cyclo-ligase n=1 Tax=Saccharothrix violaceirubra TaxID=413306 RepID=A0A7W7WTI2_9PSEU|nr:5-formyltetrahydrofolate cyclo-ligase [Saccharothrix violaceirubra]MBB4963226.1 5-formyltetrahydrofolate cyclo-ligase [Saccharothrix violaceirubra]
MTTVDQAKQQARNRVWDLLERERAAPPGVHGRIPAFHGAEQAAERLAGLPQWRDAEVVKAVPDTAQQPVRAQALRDGKLLYMATSKLAHQYPFILLDPAALDPDDAADRHTATRIGRPVEVDTMRPVDLIVCGSVAVNRHGTRLGKGAGYSDIEVALLQEAGLIGRHTTIATTVHDLQVVDDDLPETHHDFSVDLIVTPTTVIACPDPRRPHGLHWDDLPPDKIAAIPALNARHNTDKHH